MVQHKPFTANLKNVRQEGLSVAITFTSHAERKLLRLSKLGVTRNKVVETILKPDKVSLGYFGRKIAQSNLTPKIVLRVVFEERNNNILIITIYPGERRRYDEDKL